MLWLHIKSLRGLFLICRAKVALFSNSLEDFLIHWRVAPKHLQLIALRHGRSVKKVRFARENHKLTTEEQKERTLEGQMIRFAISTSDFISDLQESCLQIGREKHLVTGYPRNDALLAPPASSRGAWQHFLGNNSPQKTMLYAPSWRHFRYPTQFFPFKDFDLFQLKTFLEGNNILLLLRPHKNDLIKYSEVTTFLKELTNASEMIKVLSHNEVGDINSVLAFSDILLSDYSAIYHDYLLLDKPMIFIPYDYDDFKIQNGFLYDYYEYLPGPAVESFEELKGEITDIVLGHDKFIKKRHRLRDLIHTYQDSRSCERVAQAMDKLRR